MPPEEAGTLDPAGLVAEPFFRHFADSDSEYPDWGTGDWLYGQSIDANDHLPALPLLGTGMEQINNHAKILAEAIPSHSAPTGSQPVGNLLLQENINVDSVYRDSHNWPLREDTEKRDRWLHSDYLNPALSCVHGLFQQCVQFINYMP